MTYHSQTQQITFHVLFFFPESWKELYGDSSVCACCDSTCAFKQSKGMFAFVYMKMRQLYRILKLVYFTMQYMQQ